MYHEESDTPALVRTMALNEDLGQVLSVLTTVCKVLRSMSHPWYIIRL